MFHKCLHATALTIGLVRRQTSCNTFEGRKQSRIAPLQNYIMFCFPTALITSYVDETRTSDSTPRALSAVLHDAD